MKITYDKVADAPCIYFQDTKVKFTYPCDPKEVQGMINIDSDEKIN